MTDEEKGKLNLEMAEALDDMDKDLSSDNADFLEAALKKLRHDVELSDREQKKLETLYKKHFGDEEEKESTEDEDDIDEDDFV